MIKTLQAKAFKAIPYLETSSLMTTHPKGIKFSTTKPNVIVGPNGSGKSALLKALALHTLSYFTGQSNFDDHFVTGRDSELYWHKEREWGNDYTFLKGLTCDSDLGAALFYRPGHIPGNETCITTAMMTGYFEEAKAFARLVENKSSGQQSQAVLSKVTAMLAGQTGECQYSYLNWRFGKAPKDLSRSGFTGSYEYQAEILKRTYQDMLGVPLVLMDEPEQSLDAKAELQLWHHIVKADAKQVQTIIATHSLYPLLHPKKFHLIEAEPGYMAEVLALL